ncbi:tyrosine-type recombinase/integrase [Salinibacterium sp.]|uniref:tyrosine-type recombinase/integrase n=1 Tax=Salinibacterium sp. TaxID=1915057 RepID=UPI00286CDD11|nr:tyrosine-type recombinase/integrase [Salinibacterium sp.]
MGSVSSYEIADGRRYRVKYRDPDRKSRQKDGFTRKRDAEDYLANITVSTNRGEYVDPKTARVTVRELGTDWIGNRSHMKPSSFAAVESAWRIHVEPFWGDRRLGDILFSEVQSWVARLSAGDAKQRSATVVIRAYGVLAAILDVAVRDRRITSNPARGVKLPRKTRKKRAYLTGAQVELLVTHCIDHTTLVYTLAYTGVRWGEAIGLRVSSLDMLRRRMLIQENAVHIGRTVIVGTPKTHENRSVPFPKFLAEHLAKSCEGKRRDQLVFGAGDVHMVKTSSDTGWFVRAVRKCQAVDGDFPFITPHDLRHTAASMAISAGANPKAVQRMLGHASAAMTLDTYADLFEDDLDAVSNRLDAVRTETVVGVSWDVTAPVKQIAP